MAFVPIVLGIKPAYPSRQFSTIDIIYFTADKTQQLKLSFIEIEKAKRIIERDGKEWIAKLWKYTDDLSDWEILK